jgi:hypothetical protein
MKPHLSDKCTSRRLDENEKNVKAKIHFLANPTAMEQSSKIKNSKPSSRRK